MWLELTDYQKEALYNLNKSIGLFNDHCENLVKDLLKEIEPILNELRRFINAKFNVKNKHEVVKTIRSYSYVMINKPRDIHCGSNC